MSRRRSSKPIAWLVPIYLGLCIVFGGASAGGYLANGGLQLAAIALLGLAFLTEKGPNTIHRDRPLMVVVAIALVLVALQFIPLPAGAWSWLPGRAEIIAPLKAAGIPFPYGFISLIPHESLKSALWLLPALAVMLLMLRNPHVWSARRIAWALTATMCVTVVLGAMQRAAGASSALYFYQFTNRGTAVGFFANANHMASLLLVTIPFQCALLRDAFDRGGRKRIALVASLSGTLAVTATGILVVGSLAGYGLLVPVAIASAYLLKGERRIGGKLMVPLILVVIGTMTLILATTTGLALLDQASGMTEGSRSVIFARTWAAIREYWPIGSGLGTFAEVYPSFEDPLTVTRTYINHAHNDYLELLLEFGAAGLIGLLCFFLWWTARAYHVWVDPLASLFAKAAVIASASLLIHSSVDYPLRTAALSSIFAACLALLCVRPMNVFRVGRDENLSPKGSP